MFWTRDGKAPISGFSKVKERLDEGALKLMRKGNPDAALAPFRVHDFRVTCQTRMAALGVGTELIDATLGRVKQGLRKIYDKHGYLDEKREAMAAYGAHIMGIVR